MPLTPAAFSWAEIGTAIFCALTGSLLGLSAPGFDLWYVAWFGLAPALFAVYKSASKRQAFSRAFIFGLAYNLVYLQWVLSTRAQAFAWSGLPAEQPLLMPLVGWLAFAGQQAMIVGVFAFLLRAIPQVSSLLPARIDGKTYWPSLLIAPLLWIVIVNKLGNASCLLGAPWSMLEYSQYKQTGILQLCPYIGGLGIEALLLLANIFIVGLFFTLPVVPQPQNLLSKPLRQYLNQTASLALGLALVAAVCIKNSAIDNEIQPVKKVPIYVLQGNVNSLLTNITPRQIVDRHVSMACSLPPGLCIWTEWSVPCSISARPDVFAKLAAIARTRHQDWLVGAMDRNAAGQMFNAACLLSKEGATVKPAYYKRYLVPFGEYVPKLFKNSPLNALLSGPNDEDFTPGSRATVMHLKDTTVAPIICFESISPELVAASVRAGGSLIANLSDTKWFGSPALNDQMIAFCVLRAAENHRAFVFATNTGPSAIIDASGAIRKLAPRDSTFILSDAIPLYDNVTFFSRWCR